MVTKTKKGEAPKHHKQTKPYLQVYLPYLPLLILLVGIFASILVSLKPKTSVLGAVTNVNPSSLLVSTNKQRLANHDPSLVVNDALARAAQNKANDMVKRNYWAHATPDGQTPWSFISASGYAYQYAGENLAYGFVSSDDAVSGWMNSQEHRQNLLDKKYTEAGFGIAESEDYLGHGPETVIVALYTSPAGTTAVLGAATQAATGSHKITAIQTLTHGSMPWATSAAVALALLAGGFMVLRRNKKVLKKLKRGEKAILAHPLVDVTILAFILLIAILCRTTGIIK